MAKNNTVDVVGEYNGMPYITTDELVRISPLKGFDPIVQPAYGVPDPIVQPAYGVPEPIVQPAYGVPEPIVQPAYGVPEPIVQPAYGVPEPIVQPAYGVPEPIVQPAYGVPAPDINLSYKEIEENIATLKSTISTLKTSWDGETKNGVNKLKNSWAGEDCSEYVSKLLGMDKSVQNTISALELLCSTYEQARDMMAVSQKATISAIKNI